MIQKNKVRRVPGLVKAYRLMKLGYSIFKGREMRRVINKNASYYKIKTDDYKNVFSGYYDHSPFKPDDETIILLNANNYPTWRTPSSRAPTYLVLFDWFSSRTIKILGTTFAWNWQQGSRATWLTNDTVGFNIFDPFTMTYRTKIVRENGCEEQLLPIPIQEYAQNGIIYSINYSALYKVRPDYGYRNIKPTNEDLDENRITSYNLSNGQQNYHVSVQELIKDANKRNEKPITLAKLNHVMASPSGNHLIFLFRYFTNERRVTDLYKLEVKSNSWKILAADANVSHTCWLNNDIVLATMQGPNGFGYYRIYINNSRIECCFLHADGHPNPLNENLILTDTYPDKMGLRRLLAIPYDKPNSPVQLAVCAEPLLFQGETRCDLHPSISPSGKWIQINIAEGHQRTVGILENPFVSST